MGLCAVHWPHLNMRYFDSFVSIVWLLYRWFPSLVVWCAYFFKISITCSLLDRDSFNRVHQLTVRFPLTYPNEAPTCHADLPEKFTFTWIPGERTLLSLVDQFKERLSMFSDFWNEVADLDQNLCILEPENPSYAAVSRRVALGKWETQHLKVFHYFFK